MRQDEFRNYTERFLCVLPRFKHFNTYLYNETEERFEVCEDPDRIKDLWVIGSNGKLPRTIDGKPQQEDYSSVHLDIMRSFKSQVVYPSNESNGITALWRLNNAIVQGSEDARERLLNYCETEGMPLFRVISGDKIFHGFEVRFFHRQMSNINDFLAWVKKCAEGFEDPLIIHGREIDSLNANVNIRLNVSEDDRIIRYECRDLIHAVMIWLIYRACARNNPLGICEICGSPFVPSRASQRRCFECGSSSRIRMRESRKRKQKSMTGGVENGGQAGQ